MVFMRKTVEVYVKRKNVPVVADYSSFATDHAACRGSIYKEESYVKHKTKKIMPEMDELALKLAIDVCDELRAELKMQDVGSLKGKIFAYIKGVKNTPTIVVGKNKIEGLPEKEQLISLLR